ncbi:MAG: D-glycero-beta-D-manno-heptose-7-phosphate kinase [Leptospirillia bacterium]
MPHATPAQIESLLARMQGTEVLVVGDLMLDEYLWGAVDRVSPEAPVQVVDITATTHALGGAANVARNVAALGGRPLLAGVIGKDDAGDTLCDLLTTAGIDQTGVIRADSRPTTRKTRVMAQRQQVMRYDREVREPVGADAARELIQVAESALAGCAALLISDYAKGGVTEDLCSRLIAAAKKRGVPVCVDPKGTNAAKYTGATLVTPNLKEAAQLTGGSLSDDDAVERAGSDIRKAGKFDYVLMTRSERGMSLFGENTTHHIPTRAREVYDVTGAGDTVLAAVGLALASGCAPEEAASLANDAAGVVVGKVGAAVATPLEVIQHVRALGGATEDKLLSREALFETATRLKREGRRIVFTNGCFDLLHVGHVRYLQKARELGDVLVLAINTDASVQKLKGPGRPVVPETERAYVLSALSCVDYVTLFDEDTPQVLIEGVRPDVLVKGGDYTPEQVVGRETVEADGGEVVIVPYLLGKSTTEMIQRINEA